MNKNAIFNFGPDSIFGFDDVLEALRNNLTASTAITTTTTSFVLTDGTDTFTVTGTGFTYITIASQTYLTGGTIDSFELDRLGTVLGSITSINLDASILNSALLDEFFGFAPLALENLVLTQNWTFEGTNGADILTEGMITPDGVPYAPSGDDVAYLYGGNDVFASGAGNDSIFGGSGRDQLFGGAGDDVMYGAGAKDFMRGGFGADTMYGGSDDDTMYGEAGKDLMYGDGGDDLMFGGTGDDFLFGGAGDDRMYGGDGVNTFDGDIGDDRMYAGDDADTFVFYGTTDDDRVFGYDFNEDTISISGTEFLSVAILADQVILNHTGGSITLEGVSITNVADYSALLDSFDITYGLA